MSPILRMQVRDFVESEHEASILEVQARDFRASLDDPLTPTDRLVVMSTRGGACSFQFNMRPDQARDLAAKLVQCAEAMEAGPGATA